MRKWRVRGVVALVLILATSQVEAGYRLPPDPINPTSSAQCKALYQQYRSVADALMQEAHQIFRAADRSLEPGSTRWGRAREPGHTLQREALDVGHAGSVAQTRCMQAVDANNRRIAAEESQRRGIEAEQRRQQSSSRLPDNHFLRQPDLMRQRAAAAAQLRREEAAREQQRRDAETRKELYGTVGRMFQSALTGQRPEAPSEDARYNKAHDSADKTAAKIRPDNDIVNKYQDAASDEVRYRNQQSLSRLGEVGRQISDFGNQSAPKVSNPWTAPPIGRPDPAANPWVSSGGPSTSAPTTSAPTTSGQNPWGSSTSNQVALAKPNENPWGTQPATPSEANLDSPGPSDKSEPPSRSAERSAMTTPPQGFVYFRDRPGGPLRLVQLRALTDRRGDDAAKGQAGCSLSGVGIVVPVCEASRTDMNRSQPVANPWGGGGVR